MWLSSSLHAAHSTVQPSGSSNSWSLVFCSNVLRLSSGVLQATSEASSIHGKHRLFGAFLICDFENMDTIKRRLHTEHVILRGALSLVSSSCLHRLQRRPAPSMHAEQPNGDKLCQIRGNGWGVWWHLLHQRQGGWATVALIGIPCAV